MIQTALFILCLAVLQLTSACAVFRIGPAAHIAEVDEGTTAEKNLDAVRAMERDLPPHSRAGPEPLVRPRNAEPSGERYSSMELVPTQSSSRLAPVTPADNAIPQWTPPPVSRPSPPDRPVPAYTIPAPAAPGQSGTARCIPDGLGGQRCMR